MAVMVFVTWCLSHPKAVLSFLKYREKSWLLGTGPCLPPAHHPLLTPESRAGNTPTPGTARVGVSVPRYPPWHLPGSPFPTRFQPQLQSSRQVPKASSTLLSTMNQEQIC